MENEFASHERKASRVHCNLRLRFIVLTGSASIGAAGDLEGGLEA